MLRELQADPKIGDTIAEVRGLGLMVGIEFKSPTDPYTPAQGKVPAKMASRVQNKCLEKDMLTLTTSVYETMRSVPSCFVPLSKPADTRKSSLFGCFVMLGTDSSRLSTSRRRTWRRRARSSRRRSPRSSTRVEQVSHAEGESRSPVSGRV